MELEPEFEEFVERVGEAGDVDPVAELLWVSGVTARDVEVSRTGVYLAVTTRWSTAVCTGAEVVALGRWLFGRVEFEGRARRPWVRVDARVW